jgi:predicted ArsR family transcriptional regulator
MRTTSGERLEAIWRAVEREPGIRAAGVARRLGVARTAVMRALPALEDAGLLLSEGGRGELRTWRRGIGRNGQDLHDLQDARGECEVCVAGDVVV